MIADGAGQQDLVPRTYGTSIDFDAWQGNADAGGSDVHAIGLAALDNLGISAAHGNARPLKRLRHGTDLRCEN
jgi:hypothetical protein